MVDFITTLDQNLAAVTPTKRLKSVRSLSRMANVPEVDTTDVPHWPSFPGRHTASQAFMIALHRVLRRKEVIAVTATAPLPTPTAAHTASEGTDATPLWQSPDMKSPL
jgi:hypothetical protein